MTTVSQIYDKDERLEKALEDVAELEPDFESALLTAAEAEADYDIAYARAYLEAEGTEKAREASAKLKVEKFLRAKNDAKAVKEFIRAKLKDRQDTVSARQTLLNSEIRTNKAF